MISQYVPSSLILSSFREELYTFINDSNVFYPEWRNDSDHSEGFAIYYDSGKTNLAGYCLVSNNKAPLNYDEGATQTMVFPYSDNVEPAYVTAGNLYSEDRTAHKVKFVITDCGLFIMITQTSSYDEPWKNLPNFVFLTKNGGFSWQAGTNTTGINSRGFVFKGDYAVNRDYLGESETVLTCFAPVCGTAQSVSNNQLFVTPFTSTPALPAILDSDIGRFVTDGYFAIPEFYEEVQ